MTKTSDIDLVERAEALLHQPGGGLNALDTAMEVVKKLSSTKKALSEEQTDAYHRALSAAGEGNLRMGRSKDASEQFKKLMTLAPKGSPRSFEAKCGYAKACCALKRLPEAKELLLSIEKDGQGNTVAELLLLGSAWLATDDREHAKKALKSAWSRGGTPYELALAHVDHYSNGRTPEAVGPMVAGYADALKFLKQCGHNGGNKRDPRYRFQLAMMIQEEYFHNLVYGPTKPQPKAPEPAKAAVADVAAVAKVVARAVRPGRGAQPAKPQGPRPGDPRLARPTLATDIHEEKADSFWSVQRMLETIEEVAEPFLAKQKGTDAEKKPLEVRTMLALTAAAKEEKDADQQLVLHNLYQFYARRLIDEGTITTGPHLLFPKALSAAIVEWEELNKEHPGVAEVLLHLAAARQQTGRLEQARAEAKQSAECDRSSHGAVLEAYLANPTRLDASAACPPAMLYETEAMIKCAAMMTERGPFLCEWELWDLYSEEICHVSNTQLVRAAVLIMRGNNAAGMADPVVQIGQHLIHLLPDVIDDLGETSIVGMELRELYAYMAEELLQALKVKHAADIATNPKNLEHAHACCTVFETAFAMLMDDCTLCRRINPESAKRMVKIARDVVTVRPKSATYRRNLASALLIAAKAGAAEEQEAMAEAVTLLQQSFALEGKLEWDDPRSRSSFARSSFTGRHGGEHAIPKRISEHEPEPMRQPLEEALDGPATPPRRGQGLRANSFSGIARVRKGSIHLPVGAPSPTRMARRASSFSSKRSSMDVDGNECSPCTTPQRMSLDTAANDAAVTSAFGSTKNVGNNASASADGQSRAGAEEEEEVPMAKVNESSPKARLVLAGILAKDGKPGHAEECEKLYEEATMAGPRDSQAWLAFASIAASPGEAAARLRHFGKVPQGEEATVGDGQVHMALINYMFAMNGMDTSKGFAAVPHSLALQRLLDDPQLLESVETVGRSPLGWVAVEPIIRMLGDSGKKGACEKIYLACMAGTAVSEDDQKRYMRDMGWIARFEAVASVFT
eukprot:CAMPEP_0118934274 /NCGR_PEP_ID=MMETSP1169-20130426/13730_1 /TAXON_ID=36882 /ORGANISM="Pyramimonas obovata, Strain CCMP722" /LENGTH=1023 /DNA_ID=CAMNT_0006877157 /DNA_START=393 /DNA_END=3464 /DNA_ORIENTATION=+